ncbi:MAG: AtpZ/AtpI family protein [Xanthobacteraceae bacterium]|jgi:ATP synthase protein I|nr:AtpZ/AtpI family protein [Xanthobacteraceae bacterium]
MSGDPRSGNGGGDLSDRLRRLDEKLDARNAEEMRNKPAPPPDAADRSGFTRGMKLSGDFVGGVVAGFAVGWLFDKLTGWSPWGLIVFILLGFAAGVLNVLRSVGALPKYGERREK